MEVFSSSVTTKGQATIPRVVRGHLGICPGMRVRFVWDPLKPNTAQIMLDDSNPREMVLTAAHNFAQEWSSPEDCAAFDHYESEPRGGKDFWWHRDS